MNRCNSCQRTSSWPLSTLISIGLCQGLPKGVHLDNAREFHSNALKRGCQEHGIELTFRPLAMKEKALAKLAPIGTRFRRFRTEDHLLAFLESL
jgi:transposase InsO family protein